MSIEELVKEIELLKDELQSKDEEILQLIALLNDAEK